MAENSEPLIRLEPGGKAPILTYNLPEPSIYIGHNFIELDYDADVFGGGMQTVILEEVGGSKIQVIKVVRQLTKLGLKEAKDLVETAPQKIFDGVELRDAEAARKQLEDAGATVRVTHSKAPEAVTESLADSLSHKDLVEAVDQSMRSGFSDRRLFPNVRLSSGSVRMVSGKDGRLEPVSSMRVSRQLSMLDAEEISSRKERGEELLVYKSLYGSLRYRYVTRHRPPEPRILLVETYRLATYLGSYGAGPVIKTFSLLPGERTTIGIRTFRKTEEESKEASSILDSFTEESAADFEEAIASEQTDRATYEKSFEYMAEAEAKAKWGWGSASVRGGVKGSTNAAREEAAKNTTNATNKHAQKASAKRQVEVDTSFERRETEEEERTTEREIENINLSRTLNFVFRQMNQEFISVMSLVDVRIAFFNGFADSKDEVTLPELGVLLERHVVEGERDRVRADILDALGNILDFEGKLHQDFIEERKVDSDNNYLRIRTETTSTYRDPETDTTIDVPGIILSATKNVMRTDGVIVESLLGVSGALDEYASRLQELEVEQRMADVHKEQALAEREALTNQAIQDNDKERVALLKELGELKPLEVPLEFALRPRRDTEDE